MKDDIQVQFGETGFQEIPSWQDANTQGKSHQGIHISQWLITAI